MDEEEKMQVEPQAARSKVQEENGGQPLPVPTAPESRLRARAPAGSQVPPALDSTPAGRCATPCATRCQGEAYEGSLEEELKEIDKALEDAGGDQLQEEPQAASCKESESLPLATECKREGDRVAVEGVDCRELQDSKQNQSTPSESPEGDPPPPSEPAALPGGGFSDEFLREHFHSLQEQASKLKKAYPDFDLSRELENPNFLRMTGPEMKIPLDLAYFALHKDDLINHSMEIAAKATEEKLAASLRTTGARPRENGAGNRSASVGHIDYAHMSKAEKDRFLAYASAETQSGRKVYL